MNKENAYATNVDKLARLIAAINENNIADAQMLIRTITLKVLLDELKEGTPLYKALEPLTSDNPIMASLEEKLRTNTNTFGGKRRRRSTRRRRTHKKTRKSPKRN